MKELRAKARGARWRGDYHQAGDFYLLSGDRKSALKMYLKGGFHPQAAKIYEEEEEYELAAELYAQARDFNAAAFAFRRGKQFGKACEMYERARNFVAAAEMSLETHQVFKAAELYERGQQLESAVGLYLKTHNYAAALRCLEAMRRELESLKSGPKATEARRQDDALCERCGEVAMLLGEPLRAAGFFEDAGAQRKAAGAYRRAGELLQAARMLVELEEYGGAEELIRDLPGGGGDSELQAEILIGLKRYVEAAELLLKAGYLRRAAECYEKGRAWTTAAELYLKLGEPLKAAPLFERGGGSDRRRAAEAYAAGGEIDAAAQLYEALGDMEAAVGLLMSRGQVVSAAALLRKQGETTRAVSLLREVKHDSAQLVESRLALGRLLLELNRPAEAIEALEDAIGERPTARDLEACYLLGQAYERMHRDQDAITAYRRVEELVPGYADVAERRARLEQAREAGRRSANFERMLADMVRSEGRVGDRYRVVRRLGAGGMGQVLQAYDEKLDEMVAIKFLTPTMTDNSVNLKRFILELKLARKISHPNVIKVFDYGEWEGVSFISMELINGPSLSRWLREQPSIDLKRRMVIMLQLLSGLHSAHKLGVIHRDIKPQNVLLDKQEVPKLVDFGIAQAFDAARTSRHDLLIGSPEYMAPELIRELPFDHRADIYSLAILMYEVFTGVVPFSSPQITTTLLKHLNVAPVPPSQRNAAIPTWLDQVILRGLMKEPKERFQSVAEMMSAIRRSQAK
jgi:serine/threonine-protein kinase